MTYRSGGVFLTVLVILAVGWTSCTMPAPPTVPVTTRTEPAPAKTEPLPTETEPVPTETPVPGVSPPIIPAELKVVSHLNISAGPNNITDIWAHTAPDGRSYAYLGTFNEPECREDITGVHIVDISDAANPVKVGFIPCPLGTRANDVMVEHIETAYFQGDLLVHSVELCPDQTGHSRPDAIAGIVLHDVTDPLLPRRLAPDFSLNFEVHNAYIYQQGSNTYILVVEDGGTKDFHILEVTDPSNPREVIALGWRDWLPPDAQLAVGSIPASFLHDVWARSYSTGYLNPNYAGKTIAYLSYWDAGLILLDITNPAAPIFLGDSDYLNPDPLTGNPPEGNSHSAVPTADGNLVFMGDEDFAPFRTIFTIDSGNFTGEYRSREVPSGRPLQELEGKPLTGRTVFVGTACDPSDVPPAPGEETYVAIVESGGCPLGNKISNTATAGYDGAIIFLGAGPISLEESQEKEEIPVLLVSRSTALAVLGLSPQSPAETPFPPVSTPGEKITITAVFDGWGYGRILDVSDPANITERGQYATPEALSRTAPTGNHSMHNVMVRDRTAYISWYAGGIRVVDFCDPSQPREVASFVDKANGSNFWGVYLNEHPDGKTYILGSDRDTGLWVFEAP